MILTTKIKLTEGDLRIENRFAWFPTWVGDKKIWLQRYQRLYEYRQRYRPLPSRMYIVKTKGEILCWGWDLISEKIL